MIPIQTQNERAQRHEKLMKMIKSYKLSKEEKQKLEKIKNHTMMEINLRFLRSQVNRTYKFPTARQYEEDSQSSLSEDKILRDQLSPIISKRSKLESLESQSSLIYDLRDQNLDRDSRLEKRGEINTKPISKSVSLEQSRRVHSLGNERSLEKQNQILRRVVPNRVHRQREKGDSSTKHISSQSSIKTLRAVKTRRESKTIVTPSNSTKNLLFEGKKLKLPEIRVPKHSKYMKTEKQQQDIEMAIGKKLLTESSEQPGTKNSLGKKLKVGGVEKYLNQLQRKPIKLNKDSFKEKVRLGM